MQVLLFFWSLQIFLNIFEKGCLQAKKLHFQEKKITEADIFIFLY